MGPIGEPGGGVGSFIELIARASGQIAPRRRAREAKQLTARAVVECHVRAWLAPWMYCHQTIQFHDKRNTIVSLPGHDTSGTKDRRSQSTNPLHCVEDDSAVDERFLRRLKFPVS
jgi:hypothetical protein